VFLRAGVYRPQLLKCLAEPKTFPKEGTEKNNREVYAEYIFSVTLSFSRN
jgi:hypothetical protein